LSIYLYIRQVFKSDIEKFCNDNKLSYIETSAKSGTNVKKLFDVIANSLYETQNFPTNKEKTIVLDLPLNQTENGTKKKCCGGGASIIIK
jgi:hypothetical protein